MASARPATGKATSFTVRSRSSDSVFRFRDALYEQQDLLDVKSQLHIGDPPDGAHGSGAAEAVALLAASQTDDIRQCPLTLVPCRRPCWCPCKVTVIQRELMPLKSVRISGYPRRTFRSRMFRRFLIRVGIISDTFIFDVQGASFGTMRNRGSPHRIVITTIHKTMADSPRSPPTFLSTLPDCSTWTAAPRRSRTPTSTKPRSGRATRDNSSQTSTTRITSD